MLYNLLLRSRIAKPFKRERTIGALGGLSKCSSHAQMQNSS